MRTKFFIAAVLLAGIFTSCKNEKSVDSLDVVKSEVVDNNFQVTLDVIVKKNDDFALFYSEDGTSNFTLAPVWMGVKGSENVQKVVFALPENTIPTHLRIDFGINKDQEPMTIINYKMTYAGKTFETPGASFFKYFRPNEECTQIDKVKGLIIPVKKGEKYFGPSFYPEQLVCDEIVKLVK